MYYRDSKSKTLKEVASAIGVNVSYLSDVEHGRKAPLSVERIFETSLYLDLDKQNTAKLVYHYMTEKEFPWLKSSKEDFCWDVAYKIIDSYIEYRDSMSQCSFELQEGALIAESDKPTQK